MPVRLVCSYSCCARRCWRISSSFLFTSSLAGCGEDGASGASATFEEQETTSMKRSFRTGAFDLSASLASEMEENSTIADIEAGCSLKSKWITGTYHDLVDGAETLEVPTESENLHGSKFEQNTFIFFLERWSTLIQFSASFSSMCHE